MEQYYALVEAFRKHPAQVKRAANAAGIQYRTARKYWDHGGWCPEMKPIRDVLERERLHARATLLEQGGLDPAIIAEKARLQSIAAKVAEGQMIEHARGTAASVLGSFLRMAPGIQALADRINEELEKLAKEEKVNAPYLLGIVRRYIGAFRDLTSASKDIVEMERSHLGEPSKVIGLQLQEVDDMSLEDCMKEVEAAQAAIERARADALDKIDEPLH
jgi:hypothetical protein